MVSPLSNETSFSMGWSGLWWLVSFKAATWSLTPDASHATANTDKILVTRIVGPRSLSSHSLSLSFYLVSLCLYRSLLSASYFYRRNVAASRSLGGSLVLPFVPAIISFVSISIDSTKDRRTCFIIVDLSRVFLAC